MLLNKYPFRIRLKNYTNPNVKKKGKNVGPIEVPNHITIFVAANYPSWQVTTLNYLKEKYNPSAESHFPENTEILQHLKGIPEIKPFMKKLMPFVAHVKTQVVEKGSSVLESHLPFCESEIFNINKDYFLRSLDLDSLDICEASSYHDQKLVADVCPGKPICKFEKRELDPIDKSSAVVTLVNIQPCTPFFKQTLNLYDTDTVEDVILRLKRKDRKLKYKQVELFRFNDAQKGPRQLLAFDQSIMWNKKKLDSVEKIKFCASNGLVSGDSNILGDTLCYMVS